jgi:NADH-quinone oxidoreductase subunit M
MILVYLIVILLTGAFLAWIAGIWSPLWSRIISIVSLSIDLILILTIVGQPALPGNKWIVDIKLDWIPHFGISMHLALDGLSLLMLILTLFLGIISVIISCFISSGNLCWYQCIF